MTKLRYGKVFISDSVLKNLLDLTEDSHLELIGKNGSDGTEFLVVASDANQHTWLCDSPDTTADIRRHAISINTAKEVEK